MTTIYHHRAQTPEVLECPLTRIMVASVLGGHNQEPCCSREAGFDNLSALHDHPASHVPAPAARHVQVELRASRAGALPIRGARSRRPATPARPQWVSRWFPAPWAPTRRQPAR
eukprot:6086471-Pyramimonas_sp.AAC.1